MLDDQKKIESIDSGHMIDTIAQFSQQIDEASHIINEYQIPDFIKIDDVVITGMGASGISGDIVSSLFYEKLDVPFYINKGYDLPRWVHKDSLTVFLSYSGNTDETISSFKQALQKKSNIVAITSGGKLAEYCEKRQLTYIKVPEGFQPRSAVGYLLIPLLQVLRKNKILKNTIDADIQESIEVIKKSSKENNKEIITNENPAKKLAQKLHHTIPKIYGWGLYNPVAQRWRTQFNENSKLIADYDILPEASHNDIVGWSSDLDDTKYFSCILFRDAHEETIYMKARLDFMKSIFEDSAKCVQEIKPEGKSRLARALYAMNYGDFVSCYLAFLREVDPTPIDAINELKRQLASL